MGEAVRARRRRRPERTAGGRAPILPLPSELLFQSAVCRTRSPAAGPRIWCLAVRQPISVIAPRLATGRRSSAPLGNGAGCSWEALRGRSGARLRLEEALDGRGLSALDRCGAIRARTNLPSSGSAPSSVENHGRTAANFAGPRAAGIPESRRPRRPHSPPLDRLPRAPGSARKFGPRCRECSAAGKPAFMPRPRIGLRREVGPGVAGGASIFAAGRRVSVAAGAQAIRGRLSRRGAP
jgi:hypothetical protein